MAGRLRERWHPVMRCEELVPRHVAQSRLLGQELVLWRDDAGRANAWENRCPHRGVRLSIGINDGVELRCRYHGWRFAGGSGRCTFIPAHPSQVPASTIAARPYGVAEAYGFVWVVLGPPDGALPSDARLDDRQVTTLRSLFIDAPPACVSAALEGAAPEGLRVHWLQPVDERHTVLHAAVLDVAAAQHAGAGRLALLRRHHDALVEVRARAELGFASSAAC